MKSSARSNFGGASGGWFLPGVQALRTFPPEQGVLPAANRFFAGSRTRKRRQKRLKLERVRGGAFQVLQAKSARTDFVFARLFRAVQRRRLAAVALGEERISIKEKTAVVAKAISVRSRQFRAPRDQTRLAQTRLERFPERSVSPAPVASAASSVHVSVSPASFGARSLGAGSDESCCEQRIAKELDAFRMLGAISAARRIRTSGHVALRIWFAAKIRVYIAISLQPLLTATAEPRGGSMPAAASRVWADFLFFQRAPPQATCPVLAVSSRECYACR